MVYFSQILREIKTIFFFLFFQSVSSKAGSALEFTNQRRCNTNYDWIDLQRKAAEKAEKDGSVTSAATLIDGTPLTPQQLGLMGMEALETVVGYWEDALAAYQPRNGVNHVLTTAEEAAFVKMLENILEAGYNLQEESEHMFIHQESILNRPKRNVYFAPDLKSEVDGSVLSICTSKGNLLSVSSVDQVCIYYPSHSVEIIKFYVKSILGIFEAQKLPF